MFLQEVSQLQKGITAQELKLEQKKEQKHSLLQQCKMEDIPLPFKKGAIQDIEHSVRISILTFIFFAFVLHNEVMRLMTKP